MKIWLVGHFCYQSQILLAKLQLAFAILAKTSAVRAVKNPMNRTIAAAMVSAVKARFA